MTPVIFGPEERALAGVYHEPPSGAPPGVAVVLCNPLGYEAMSVHRTYRHLAERLAQAGHPALRFDYDGTGDSSGRGDDPGRVRAWVESVRHAIAAIRARAGAGPVALFGVRLGATLAAAAAAEEGGVEALIAWAPALSGRAYAREIRAFRMIKDPRAPVAPRTDGAEEVAGYLYTKETLDDLARLDLASGPAAARRVLVLGRERSTEETRWTERLATLGVEARLIPAAGYAAMMRDDPYETTVPFEAIDAIVRWLSEVSPRAPRGPVTPPARSRESFPVSTPGGAALVETPLVLAEGLFGVLTEPAARADAGRPVLCLLNVGANHHVGPHRMNVTLARNFAERGYATLRLDAAGLGESRAPEGRPENLIYTMDAIADVESALSRMTALRGARRFVLVGLCSGAYLAYHTAIADPRVVGQMIVSPFAFEWKAGDPVTPTMRKPVRSTRFYTRALLDRRVWARAARGDVNVRVIAAGILERLRDGVEANLPRWRARLRGAALGKNPVERAFSAMSDRGVETLIVLSFDDGGVDTVARYLGHDARAMRGRANFAFEVVEGGDHTFKTLASQASLRDLVAGWLTTRFP